MKGRRGPSWDATGLVEKAWLRLDRPRRDRLAELMGVAGSDLSARNRGQAMTLDYAERIAAVVQRFDPTFTVADLGAPSSAWTEADQTVLDRLRGVEEREKKLEEKAAALEAELARRPTAEIIRGTVAALEGRLAALETALERVGA